MKIGNKEFKYKKDALIYYKRILNSYLPKQTVSRKDFKDLIELIEIRHDKDKKIGCGIEFIQVIEGRHKIKCFQLVRINGSKEVFSYIKCINGKSKPLAKFVKTCRETVIDELRNVKKVFFEKTPTKD